MYYMKYSTTITSKGTITIAAPLRRALGLRTGQKVSLSVDKNNQLIIDGGIDINDFEKLRNEITKKIPNHLKGLQGDALREARAKAWVADHHE